jgi:hypothetical protein
MFEIIVMICKLNTPPDECTQETARSVWVIGETDSNLSCMLQGALGVATGKVETNNDEYIKFECVEQIRS